MCISLKSFIIEFSFKGDILNKPMILGHENLSKDQHQRRRRYDSIVTLLPKEDRRIKWPIVNCIAIFRKQIAVYILFYIHFLHRGIICLGIGQNFQGPR